MSKTTKAESIHIRITTQVKAEIEKEARKNYRSLQDEVLILLAQALHARKFTPEDWR